ncbi:Pycsar system effector family protein [Maribacter sp. 2210JD10-5]|uniref:Pycsar system effector family protein n=1 Tax=Maribacter sp. 2210JD10-5 TaxID=3386272 RepID=UPI0039BD4021
MIAEKTSKPSSRTFTSMLNTTLRNHYMLNQMVDRKARIILSLNVVILSLIIGNILKSTLEFNSVIIVLFGGSIFCVLSIIFSVLAILPEKDKNMLTAEKMKSNEMNPLFFGNYLNMPYTSFEDTMIEMRADTDFAHRAMLKDMYHVGKILERKRKFLRYSVIAMTIGICLSLLLAICIKVVFV